MKRGSGVLFDFEGSFSLPGEFSSLPTNVGVMFSKPGKTQDDFLFS